MNIACNFVSCVILNVPLTDWYRLDGYLKSEPSLIHLQKLQSKSFPVSIRVEKVLRFTIHGSLSVLESAWIGGIEDGSHVRMRCDDKHCCSRRVLRLESQPSMIDVHTLHRNICAAHWSIGVNVNK